MQEEFKKAEDQAAGFLAQEELKRKDAEAKRLKREEEREKPLNKTKKESATVTKELATLETMLSDIKATSKSCLPST